MLFGVGITAYSTFCACCAFPNLRTNLNIIAQRISIPKLIAKHAFKTSMVNTQHGDCLRTLNPL